MSVCQIQLARYRLRFPDADQIVPCLRAYRDLRDAQGAPAARRGLPALVTHCGGTTSPMPEPPDWLAAYGCIDHIEAYLRGFANRDGPDPARAMQATLVLRRAMTALLEEAVVQHPSGRRPIG